MRPAWAVPFLPFLKPTAASARDSKALVNIAAVAQILPSAQPQVAAQLAEHISSVTQNHLPTAPFPMYICSLLQLTRNKSVS